MSFWHSKHSLSSTHESCEHSQILTNSPVDSASVIHNLKDEKDSKTMSLCKIQCKHSLSPQVSNLDNNLSRVHLRGGCQHPLGIS